LTRRDLREEAPHLPLRAHAAAQAPVSLQEQAVADEKSGVGAFGRRTPDGGGIEIRRQEIGERAGGLESERSAAAADRAAAVPGDLLDQVAAEFLLRERVEQDARL